jgi:hypothetical protein
MFGYRDIQKHVNFHVNVGEHVPEKASRQGQEGLVGGFLKGYENNF